MTLRQLEYFIATARAGSFVNAAKVLGVSQPTLSQQIRALETEIGGPLLVRGPRRVRLTPTGRAFIGDAYAAVTSARRAMAAGQRAVHVVPEVLTVATVRSLAAATLPAVISDWHRQRPEVSVRLQEFANRGEFAASVLEGEADLGVGPLPQGWTGIHRELGWEQLVLVLPSRDPLLQIRANIELSSLADREWVLFEKYHGLGQRSLAACHAAGFEPQGAVRTAQVEAAVRLAVAGLGPVLVPINNIPADMRSFARGVEPAISSRIWAIGPGRRFSPTPAAFARLLSAGPWQKQRVVDVD
jgi:DNA-binding transcriptional LysR family regulator